LTKIKIYFIFSSVLFRGFLKNKQKEGGLSGMKDNEKQEIKQESLYALDDSACKKAGEKASYESGEIKEAEKQPIGCIK
jgi:hypothetical protein